MTPSGSTAISVIQAGWKDADVFAALHSELFTPAWDNASFVALMNQPGSLAFRAETSDGGLPVGFILGRVVADEAEILSMGVTGDWRGWLPYGAQNVCSSRSQQTTNPRGSFTWRRVSARSGAVPPTMIGRMNRAWTH